MGDSPAVGTTNISFKNPLYGVGGNSLLIACQEGGFEGITNPGTTNISLGDFRGADFTDGSSVPSGSAAISIGTHFQGKTFGASSGSSGGGCG